MLGLKVLGPTKKMKYQEEVGAGRVSLGRPLGIGLRSQRRLPGARPYLSRWKAAISALCL